MIISRESGPLTFLTLTEAEAEQIPENMRHETEVVGDFMVLGNEAECELLENICKGAFVFKHQHDFFIISIEA